MKNCILAFLFLIAATRAAAQIEEARLLNRLPLQYKRSDWIIYLKAEWANPYLQEDIALDAHIKTPSGKLISLPCYYDSGSSAQRSRWRARFAPQEQGKYSCRFILSKNGRPIDSSRTYKFSSHASGDDGILHAGGNWVLRFDSGRPFRGIGENIGWESRASDDSKYFSGLHQQPKYNYEYMLPSLAAHGGNFFRTWICPFNLPIDWKKASNSNRYTETTEYFNPSAIAKMDRLVELCDSLHLHMMLTLGQGAYRAADGGHTSSAADFFVNGEAKQQYRNRLRYFVARWGYSPAIGAWEFFNEVDNVQFSNRNSPIDPASIVAWHREMSDYLSGLDPYDHIITTSISHRDVAGLNGLPSIDINQKHIYKNTKAIPAEIVRYEESFHKPYIIGEYSYEWDWSKDFNQFAGSMDSDYRKGLWYGLFSPTPVLPLSWWWEFFDSRGTDRYLSKVRRISDSMLHAGNGQYEPLPVINEGDSVEAYAVRCGRQIFIYLHNSNTVPAKAALRLACSNLPKPDASACNPENDAWQALPPVLKQGDALHIAGPELLPGGDRILIVGLK